MSKTSNTIIPKELVYKTICNSGMTGSTTAITSSLMSGYGDDYFNNKFYIYIVKNANSVGNAPETQVRLVSDYVSSTGTFTTDAFGSNVEANDEIFIVHESLVWLFGTISSSGVVNDFDGNLMEVIKSGLEKTTGGAFDPDTDSNEAITNKVGAFAGTAGAGYNESLYAILVLLSKYVADGDGDFATGTVLPANKSLYDMAVVDTKIKQLINAAEGAGAFPANVLDNSILSFVLSKVANGDTSSYDNTTDSLEMTSDKLGAFTGNGGVAQADSVKASLDILHTSVGAGIGATVTDIDNDLGEPGDAAAINTTVHAKLNGLIAALGVTAAGGGKFEVDGTPNLYDVIAALNNISTAQVNAEVLDVVNTDGKLDKLISTDDRPAATVYPVSVVAESILAFIMSKSASPDASSFNNTTDSLEAISDYIQGVTTLPNGAKRETGRTQIITSTFNTNAGDAALLTATTAGVLIKRVVFRNGSNLTADATLGYVSFEVPDTTTITIIDSTAGAKVNLTTQAQISWSGAIYVATGSTINLNVDAASTTSSSCTLIVEYEAVTDGGYLT